jgi:hypothetical protein
MKMTVILGSQSAATAPKLVGATVPATGWTETWWLPTSNFAGNLLIAQNYVVVRAALLGIGAFIQAVKLTLPGVQPVNLKRQSQVYYPPTGVGGATVYDSPGVDDYDPTQVDLQFRIEAGPAKRRTLFLGGLPDSQTDTFQVGGMLQSYLNGPQMKRFQAFVIANFGSRDIVPPRITPPSANTYLYNAITAVIPIQTRNRKRGRPFFLFRGRRTV